MGRRWGAAALLALLAAGCGDEGPADELAAPAAGTRLEVVEASFPRRQGVAQSAELRIRVRNADTETVPDVTVVVETGPREGSDGLLAFGQRSSQPQLADAERPVWILDEGPDGGETAATNAWALGPLAAGASRVFSWTVTAVEPGRYTLAYRAYASLGGGMERTGAGTGGRMRISIADDPVPATVGADGEVVRGEAP